MSGNFVRFLIFTLVLVNITPAQQGGKKPRPPQTPQTQSTIKGRWYIFNAPDKDFVIEFPDKPKREADSEAPSGTMRNYVLDTGSMSFSLSYVDVGLDPTSRDGNQLPLTFRQSMLDHARERGWTVLRSEMLRKNVYEQETWSPMKGNPTLKLHYLERNVVRYGRQYVLTCASLIPEQKVTLDLCQRFFSSFRSIREPQPQ
jgi:hypothetical protein